jgi:hypothetical protein
MKKPDLGAIKTFFFEKGEKVGVVLCTAVMVLIVGWSLYKGFTTAGAPSGKSWPDEIKGVAEALDRQMQAPAGDKPAPPKMGPPWQPEQNNFAWASLFNLPDKAFTKKLNPRILTILPPEEGEKHFQMDVMRDVYLRYELEPGAKKVWAIAGGAGGAAGPMAAMPMMPKGVPGGVAGAAGGLGANNLAMDVRPVRMVVVSAIYPMREQLEEFRKALRYATIGELLARRDLLPKPIGLEVMRAEILPGGKATPWTPVFKQDAKTGKTVMAPTIKRMLREMVIDTQNPQTLAHYIFPGLVTPLPRLGHGDYPELELKGIEPGAMVAAANGDPMNLNPMARMMPKVPGRPKLPGKFPGVVKPNPMPVDGGEEGGAAGPALGEVQFRQEAWSKIAKDLQERFEEKYFAFDPLGIPLPEPKKGAAGAIMPGGVPGVPMPNMAAMMQGMQGGMEGGAAANFSNPWDRILGGAGGGAMFGPMGMPMPMPGGEVPMAEPVEGEAPMQNPNAAIELKDALVRFFDPDVEPGKTYRYSIRVRMANPNFGKKTDVAFGALAELKELDWAAGPPKGWPNQGWMLSPEVTIPGDYFWYATDQDPEVKIRNGADFAGPQRADMAPIQVHRWLERPNEGDSPIGTWAIAERFWVRRGDVVGRTNVMVEVPLWNKNKQAFEIANLPQVARGKKAPKAVINSGLPVSLTTTPPSLIVDFDGGQRSNVRVGKDLVSNDASAVEMLVLTPEGDLVVRHSRRDTDPEAPEGDERNERYEQWRDRLAELRAGGGRPAMGPGMMMPMPGGAAGGMP